MVTSSQIVGLIEQSLSNEGISKVHIEIIGHLESEGFVSNAIFVKASGNTQNGSSKSYNLIVKYVKDTKQFRNSMDVQRICKSEFHMYKNVFPVFNALIEEKGLNESIAVPECYGCYVIDNTYIIVLEHLNTTGFRVQNKTLTLSLDHLKLILREHAKMHALSVTLKLQKKELYEEVIPQGTELFDMSITDPNVRDVVNEGTWIAINSLKGKDEDLYKKMCSLFEKTPADIYMHLLRLSGSEKKTVLNHGDCWNDNYLFRYKDANDARSLEAMIIDFQSSQIHSPIYDVSNLIYSVSDCNLEHFGELMRSYHDSLTYYLTKLGSDPNYFTIEDLKEHWKKYSFRGLIVALYTVRVLIAVKPKDGADEGFFNIISDISQEYLIYRRVRSITRHYFHSMSIIDSI